MGVQGKHPEACYKWGCLGPTPRSSESEGTGPEFRSLHFQQIVWVVGSRGRWIILRNTALDHLVEREDQPLVLSRRGMVAAIFIEEGQLRRKGEAAALGR